MMIRLERLLIAAALATACGSDGATDPDAGDGADAMTSPDAATGCARQPAAADRARKIVVSHPFMEGGGQATMYEVLDLSTAGEITIPDVTFSMGRAASDTRIAFTPDGEVGIAVQDDGTLGVFRFGSGAAPEIVHLDWDADGAFYASEVVIADDGAHVFILNSQWRKNGGGIYRAAIECDGALTYEGLVAASKLPVGLVLTAGGRAVVAADDILGSEAAHNGHLLQWGQTPSVITGAPAFTDDDFIVSSTALTADGTHFLIADNSAFSLFENRVSIVRIDGDAMTFVQTITPLEDPYAMATSPTNDAAIVVSGFGDAIFGLSYSPQNATTPFVLTGELTYTGARPQLPGALVMIERGPLAGLVLVAENLGVRRVQFAGGGTVNDLGVTIVGSGVGAIVGTVGVQP